MKDGHWIILKACLYFFITAMPPLIDCLGATAKYDYWPSGVRITVSILAGTVAGLVAVRAYLDSGYARYQDAKRNGQPKVTT